MYIHVYTCIYMYIYIYIYIYTHICLLDPQAVQLVSACSPDVDVLVWEGVDDDTLLEFKHSYATL